MYFLQGFMMSNSVLQDFLDNRFIKTADEGDLDKLRKASVEIQKHLRKKKSKTISYSLAALDPLISEGDPIICEAESILIKHWKAFKNSVANTRDKPISYIQAVILDALQALSKDIEFAAIIWYSSCNIIKCYRLAGQEEVLKAFLIPIGQQLEKYARNNWCIAESATVETVGLANLSLPKLSQGNISTKEFENHLKAAAVHSGWSAQAGGGENPHTPAQNNWQWANFFAERAAEGLAEEINSAFKEQSKSLEVLNTSIKKYLNSAFDEIQTYLEYASSSIPQATQSQNKRSDLIWWKQSLYSNTLDKGYRQLEKLVATLAMVVDLNNSLDEIYPKSVEYLLVETLRDVLGEDVNASIGLGELLVQLPKLDREAKNLLKGLATEAVGRKLFGSCLLAFMNGSMAEDEFFKCSGVEPGTQITFSELAVWLLHDLKAYSLSNQK